MLDDHITIPRARLAELESAERERDTLSGQVLDLAMLVGRLIQRMRAARAGNGVAAGDNALERKCISYLQRNGLTSPLREEGHNDRIQPRR